MQTKYRNVVPLIKVVRAAIIDTYGDLGKLQERYSHWGVRGLKKLQQERLRKFVRKAMLPVSRNTLTATLPLDCQEVLFAGIIDDNGRKVPMLVNSSIVNIDAVTEIEPDKCDSCGQDKNICEDIHVSEEINLIDIDGVIYEETVTKRLQPNGDYYEEKTSPVKNLTTGVVTMESSSRFVVNFDLKDCGCLDTCEENVSKLSQHCPNVYATYYTYNCDPSCKPLDLGGFNVCEEEGVIALEESYPYTHIYIEYTGFLPKANGQYLVPEIAFEALVEWIKWRAIKDKLNVSRGDKADAFTFFDMAAKNMTKNLHRASLSKIIASAAMVPRLSLIVGGGWYDCYQNNLAMMRRYKNCRPSQDACGSQQSTQVVQTIVRTETTTNQILFRKLKFTTGDAEVIANGEPVDFAAPLQEGETVLSILETGIKPDSVNVQIDTVNLPEGDPDQLSYTIVYGVNGIVITFIQEALQDQKYVITYAKEITI